jgi:heme-NO-binding protein
VHGVIFTSLRDYVDAEHGAETAQAVFEGEPLYVVSESYEDERLPDLVGRTAELTGRDADEIVHDFGVFTAETTFARLYPASFAVSPSAREFLLTVETRIHELVRATIPNASPPQLAVYELGQDGVTIAYTSPRHLCVLLRGLVEGTARHYGETAEIEEATCMLRGDLACTFHVRLSGAQRPA